MNYTDIAWDFMKKLVSFDTVESAPIADAPFGKGNRDCLDYALSVMEKYGFKTKNAGFYGYGEIGDGEMFGVLNHLDTVPIGEGWRHNPYGEEDNDRLYGRGTLDDKGPFAAAFFAAVRLIKEGRAFSRRLRFILGCDEESGWKCMEEYEKNEEMPAMGISPDGDFPVINCEKGIVYHTIRIPLPENIIDFKGGERANMVPANAECKLSFSEEILEKIKKSGLNYEVGEGTIVVKATGKAAHGSHPEMGENAIVKLLNGLSFTESFGILAEKLGNCDGSGADLKISDEASGSLTMNLGCARVENGEIVFELDVRHPVSYDRQFITEKLQKALPFEAEQGFFHLPLYVEEENPLVKTLLKAYNSVTGENARPLAIGGGTYARVLPLGVAFGPCFPGGNEGMHCADEYMSREDFEKMSEIYYRALKLIVTD